MQQKLKFDMEVTPQEALILADVLENGSVEVRMSDENAEELQRSAATLRRWGDSQLTGAPS